MGYEIVCADVMGWAESYDGPKFHAMLCDPPYHLIQSSRGGSQRQPGTGPYGRHKVSTKGFMGKEWDGGDIAYRPETWAALAQHLRPGAFGMVFASSRGWHRLAVAIEDAGLRIHPSIFGWCYGSGFPKATRIDTQVDKAAGAEREYIGEGPYAARRPRESKEAQGLIYNDDSYVRPAGDAVYGPATPLARAWQGHRYGLQAMKPALEPIIVFQKPYVGKPVDCITGAGAGALWVDGGRIGTETRTYHGSGENQHRYSDSRAGARDGRGKHLKFTAQGRWPANFTLTHHPECKRTGTRRIRQHSGDVKGTEPSHTGDENTACYGEYGRVPFQRYADPDGKETIAAWDCHPDCPVRKLGEQSGESASRSAVGVRRYGRSGGIMGKVGGLRDGRPEGHNDTGTAARFFHQSDWSYEIAERLAEADPVKYKAKASRKERDAGLESFARCANDFQRETSGLNQSRPNREGRKPATPPRNFHPTVKPIALCQWLAALLLPPPEYAPRRIMMPFCGTMSEGIGALLVGWDEVLGIDNEQEYCEIAEARAAWWTAKMQESGLSDPRSILKAHGKKKSKAPAGQEQLRLSLDGTQENGVLL